MSFLRKYKIHSPLASAGTGSRVLLDGKIHGYYGLCVEYPIVFT